MEYIEYKKGYKYQLHTTYITKIAIHPVQPIHTEYIDLTQTGHLTIRKGYAWDGPSGPTIDIPCFMRGALIHDALYQLMRMGLLLFEYRKRADMELEKACAVDGMAGWYRRLVYFAVQKFAKPSALPSHSKKIIYAPKQ